MSGITLLYEKTSKHYMIDRRIDEKEAQDLKKTPTNHYSIILTSEVKTWKNTHFKVQDVFVDIIGKKNFIQDQILKLNEVLGKIMLIMFFV